MNTWEVDHAQRIGAAVQRFRKSNGVSAQGLSDTTGELGLRMTRQAITDLENGRRRYVTTAELLILASALSVPPVVLLYPNLPNGLVEVVPEQRITSIDAMSAFVGENDEPGIRRESEGEELVRLSRELIQMKRDLKNTETIWQFAERSAERKGGDATAEFARLIEVRSSAIRNVEQRLRGIAGAVVDYSGDTDA